MYIGPKLTDYLLCFIPTSFHHLLWFKPPPYDTSNTSAPPSTDARLGLKHADYSWNNLTRRHTQWHGLFLLIHPVIWISNYISTNLRYAMAILSYDHPICSIPSSHHCSGGHRLVNYNTHYNIITTSIISPLRPSTIIYASSSGILGLGIENL
jgi:hypothetical protein